MSIPGAIVGLAGAAGRPSPQQLLNELTPWIVWFACVAGPLLATWFAVRAILAGGAAHRRAMRAAGYRFVHTGWAVVALLPFPTFDWVKRDDPRTMRDTEAGTG